MTENSQIATGDSGSQEVHTGHPTPLTYFKVAMALVVLTAAEVGIFYVEALGWGIVPVLVGLAGAKFALVAMFYMHLKYDSRLFTGIFVGGLLLAVLVFLSVMALFKVFA